MILQAYSNALRKNVKVLCVYPPLSSRKEPPPAFGHASRAYEDIHRVLMLCTECNRYHYATVDDCPDPFAPTKVLPMDDDYRMVVEGVD